MSKREQELHAKIARMILMKRLRTAGLALLILAPVLSLVYWLGYATNQSQEIVSHREVTGVLVRLHQIQSQTPQLVVELDNGESVFVGALVQVVFKKGARVRLMENQSSSGKRYAFIEYLVDE